MSSLQELVKMLTKSGAAAGRNIPPEITAALMGEAGSGLPDRANMSGYDPIKSEIMQKTYAHDPAVGDPVVTLGMDPSRVREMHPLEQPYNMGSYYPEEDTVDLNPNLSPRDRTDTAKHEFRHRGSNILTPGGTQDWDMDEMAMLLSDMGQGIGGVGYNLPAVQYIARDLAAKQGRPMAEVLQEAENLASNLNGQAREKLGGGALYQPQMERLTGGNRQMPQGAPQPTGRMESPYGAGNPGAPVVSPWLDPEAPEGFMDSAPGPMGPGMMQNPSPQNAGFPGTPQMPPMGQGPARGEEPFDPNMMPGMGEDPRDMFWQEGRNSSFIPGAEYQTADLAGLKDPGFTPLEETKTSDLAKMEMGARNAMDRLSQIDDMLNRNPDAFDDLTFQGQMKLSGARWKDYFNMDLSPEQERYLTNATQTRAAVMENMNYTIKEMTGAQMGVQEAERIMATMSGPNDTPTEFKAKLARARESTMLAVARYNYWRNKGGGGTPQDIGSIPDMNKILQQRGAEIFNEMRQSGLSNSDARLQAARTLSQEFGL